MSAVEVASTVATSIGVSS